MSSQRATRKPRTMGRTVETLTHDQARRRNIPTAEYQSVLQREQESPVQGAYQRRTRDLEPPHGIKFNSTFQWSTTTLIYEPREGQNRHAEAVVTIAEIEEALAELFGTPITPVQVEEEVEETVVHPWASPASVQIWRP